MSQRPFRLAYPALLTSVCAAALWGALAAAVHTQFEPLMSLDRTVAEDLHAYKGQSRTLTTAFRWITDAGSMQTMVVIAAVVSVALLRLHQVWLTAVWLVVLLGGEWLNHVLKDWVQRPRPPFPGNSSSWSFPSGHAMESMIGYGMLAYLLLLVYHRPRCRVFAFATLILLIGFSRLVLGAHYLTDVVGGFAAGLAWLGLWVAAIEAVHGRLGRTGPLAPGDPF